VDSNYNLKEIKLPIADYLRDENDSDILAAFRELPSRNAKVKAIQEVIELYRCSTKALLQYRCLVTVARLLVELAAETADGAIAALYTRCCEVCDITPSESHGCGPPFDMTTLSASFRNKATTQLRILIASELTPPDISWSPEITAPSIRIDSPVRLDLGMGGISDIPPYCLERRGACLNVPMLLDGRYPISSTVSVIQKSVLHLVSKDLDTESVVEDWSALDHQPPALRFHCAVLSYFRRYMQGFETFQQVSAHLRGGIRIETESRLPPGTGLGVSSLLSYAILQALTSLFGARLTPSQLVSVSVYLECLTGVGGGWEDATAMLPGVKLLETFPGRPFSPIVTPVLLNDGQLTRLRKHLLLINTGIQRKDDALLIELMERYCLRDSTILKSMERIIDLNLRLPEFLADGDLARVGQIMRAQWESWRACSEDRCTNSEINELFLKLDPYLFGARMNGTGQGGCAMLLLREEQDREEVLKIAKSMLGPSAVGYTWHAVLPAQSLPVSDSVPRRKRIPSE
jgi:galactokinase/mevalonate kinase-like predicted kinase